MLMSMDVFKKKYEFRPQTKMVMDLISSGNAQSVQGGASVAFQKKQSIKRLEDVAQRIHGVLGDFKSVLHVTKNERLSSALGTTANIRYELEFEKAHTKAEFSYIKDDNSDWRLLGFDIRIPKDLEKKFNALTNHPDRLRAPLDVVQKAKDIVVLLANGQAEQVYEDASVEFKAGTTAERFRRTVEGHNRALGKLKGLGEIKDTAQNEGKDSAHVDASLVFLKLETELDMHFYKENNEWKMSSYKVLVPDPVMPAKPTFD